MQNFNEHIQELQKEIIQTLDALITDQDLEHARVKYLGRNGTIAALMEQMKSLSVDEKRQFGPLLQALKQQAQQAYDTAKQRITDFAVAQEQLRQQYFDVTATKPLKTTGNLHIFSHLIAQLEDIFITMGYEIEMGPEVETDFYNFEALNIPSNHPARDVHDTFWLTTPNRLLRTHTSTVQIHALENKQVPFAVFAPGRCYRNEATDATHDFMFMQAEGLFIDKDVSVANLLATSKTFLRKFFEKDDLQIRARPGYFPFVEPGIEIDASCPFCKHGCSICKKTGWLELMGSGIVHPNVLRSAGIDPNKYSGFAFGCGLERLAMVKYGITDIRLFRNGNLEFLSQFK